jgi:hypothetical protein
MRLRNYYYRLHFITGSQPSSHISSNSVYIYLNIITIDINDHSGHADVAAVDRGKMDEFTLQGQGQLNQSDIPTFWSYAQQFGVNASKLITRPGFVAEYRLDP